MILERATLIPTKHVPCDKGRWSRVAVSHKGIEATDGCILMRTHRTDPDGYDEVPVVPGVPGGTNPTIAHRTMVEAKDLAHLLDRLETVRHCKPAIHLARIVDDAERAVAVVMDLRRSEVITLFLPEDQSWPNTDLLIKNLEQPRVVITYDVGLLKKLVDTLEDVDAESVQFAITEPTKGTYFAATGISGALIDGILMPCRSRGGLPTKGEAWATPQTPEEVKT